MQVDRICIEFLENNTTFVDFLGLSIFHGLSVLVPCERALRSLIQRSSEASQYDHSTKSEMNLASEDGTNFFLTRNFFILERERERSFLRAVRGAPDRLSRSVVLGHFYITGLCILGHTDIDPSSCAWSVYFRDVGIEKSMLSAR